jgi:predicted transcriptional regulator
MRTKIFKVGVMPTKEYQKYLIDVAMGRREIKKGAPKIWFNSIKCLAEALSENNIELLHMMAEVRPKSLKELAAISGRSPGNLTRTLKNLERYGIVSLEKTPGVRETRPVALATQFNIQHGAWG